MDITTFNKILEARIQSIRDVLATKQEEYGTTERLHNFKSQMIEGLKETPAQVCWGYMRKHLQSIYDMAQGTKTFAPSMINEKIGDAINYLILMEAILLEPYTNLHNAHTDS